VRRTLVELRDRFKNREANPRRPFGIVVVRDRIAEERHYAVADVSDDFAAKARNRLRHRTPVASNCSLPFFRIDSGC
jgi:hypothetical protein